MEARQRIRRGDHNRRDPHENADDVRAYALTFELRLDSRFVDRLTGIKLTQARRAS